MKILIFGSTGKIGRYITQELKKNHTLLCPERSFFKCLTYPKLYDAINNFHPERIVNLAAITDRKACDESKALAKTINHDFPVSLARATKELKIPFIHFSTDAIFPGSTTPYGEDAIAYPPNIYGESKLAGEKNVLLVNPDALILRCSTIYGFDNDCTSFLDNTLKKIIMNKAIYATDKITSNICHIKDIYEAFEQMILSLTDRDGGIYHLCAKENCSFYDFFHYAIEILSKEKSLLTKRTLEELGIKKRSLNVTLTSKRIPYLSSYKLTLAKYLMENKK